MTEIIERKALIRTEATAKKFILDRIEEAAVKFSEVVDIKMRVELANEILCRFVEKIYTRDAGAWVYLDNVTYRIITAKPWGSSGWKYYGLRQWEARVLGKVLLIRATEQQPTVLFDYNFELHDWYLNLASFRAKESAMGYLNAKPITVAEWRRAVKLCVKR